MNNKENGCPSHTNNSFGISVLLGYYTASSENSLPTFRDNLSVPFSRVKKSKKDFISKELQLQET